MKINKTIQFQILSGVPKSKTMNMAQKLSGNEKFISMTLVEHFLIRMKVLLMHQKQTKYQLAQSEVLAMAAE